MPINKRVTAVENTLGAIVWNSYEALLQSKSKSPIDKYSGPIGKYFFPEENLCTAIQRLTMGIYEMRHIILHGSQDKDTINNIKFIAYRATIEHMKESAERSKRETEKLPPPTLSEEVRTMKVQIKVVKEKAHELLQGGEDYYQDQKRKEICHVNEHYDVPAHVHHISQDE